MLNNQKSKLDLVWRSHLSIGHPCAFTSLPLKTLFETWRRIVLSFSFDSVCLNRATTKIIIINVSRQILLASRQNPESSFMDLAWDKDQMAELSVIKASPLRPHSLLSLERPTRLTERIILKPSCSINRPISIKTRKNPCSITLGTRVTSLFFNKRKLMCNSKSARIKLWFYGPYFMGIFITDCHRRSPSPGIMVYSI